MQRSARHSQDQIAEAVRRNFWPAAIAAGLMFYFGYGYFLSISGTGLFYAGDAIFQWTLRIGAIIMAFSAVSSLTGASAVLMFDGVFSVLIGALLILSAGLMILGGGFGINQVIYILCAMTFLNSGRHNVALYRQFIRERVHEVEEVEGPADRGGIAPKRSTGADLVVQRREQLPEPQVQPPREPEHEALPPSQSRPEVESPAPETPAPTKPEPKSPPPDGFLAGLADDTDERRKE